MCQLTNSTIHMGLLCEKQQRRHPDQLLEENRVGSTGLGLFVRSPLTLTQGSLRESPSDGENTIASNVFTITKAIKEI